MSKLLISSFLTSTFLLAAGCVGDAPNVNGDNDDAGPAGPDAGPTINPELVGAGDRDLLEDWPTIDLPFSQNTKMLNFEQLRNEVNRATADTAWMDVGVDQWNSHQSILGGADFDVSWQFDITPNQQKILTIRRMAFTVCGDLVNDEAGQGTRTVFADVDPGAAIDLAAPITETQVKSLYKRFFFEAASAETVTESLALLSDMQTTENQREAWRGLCTAYLGSMRFLSF